MKDAGTAPIRVLTVDDSTVIRGFLGRIIDHEPDMKVVATAMNGRVALDVLDRREVDIILLDIEMPEMDGLTALPLIQKKAPKARVIMASSLTEKGADVTVRALAAGAADYVTKPSARSAQGLEPVARELVHKIRVLAGRGAPLRAPSRAAEDQGRTPGEERLARLGSRDATPAPPRFRPSGRPPRILGIASSTGGPNALARFIADLPGDFRLPIVIAQHMPALFTAMLAERLSNAGGRPAMEGSDGLPVRDGHVYVAPGDYHMTVERTSAGEVIRLNREAQENFCRPSADPLFRSLVEVYRDAQIALILTGMGHDGMLGAEAVATAGGLVLAQDEATSVVWGMPRAVATAGIAHEILPLERLAPAVVSRTGALR